MLLWKEKPEYKRPSWWISAGCNFFSWAIHLLVIFLIIGSKKCKKLRTEETRKCWYFFLGDWFVSWQLPSCWHSNVKDRHQHCSVRPPDATEIQKSTAYQSVDNVYRAMSWGEERLRKQDLHLNQPQTSTYFYSILLDSLFRSNPQMSQKCFPPPCLHQFQAKCCWHFMDSLQCYQRLMVTFARRVKHLISPHNLKKPGYQHLISKVKFTSGCFF